TIFISETLKSPLANNVKNIVIVDALKQIDALPFHPLELEVATESIAYIVYTSGSTGKPKGVQVTHKGIINLIYSLGKKLHLSNDDTFFAITTISFDTLILETYLPLLYGACVVFIDDNLKRDGKRL